MGLSKNETHSLHFQTLQEKAVQWMDGKKELTAELEKFRKK
ncbi:hypothetical protein [Legionella sp. MW5194]|nr:hypothetical protein [Legionella sp. MW5194]